MAFIIYFFPFDIVICFLLNMEWADFFTNGGDFSILNPIESAIVLIAPKMEKKTKTTLNIESDDPLDPKMPYQNFGDPRPFPWGGVHTHTSTHTHM